MKKTISAYIKNLKKSLSTMPVDKIEILAQRIIEAGKRGNTIFVVGNGGSAATAAHFVCDLQKTILGKDAVPGKTDRTKSLRVICLSDNVPLLTAWANDSSYKSIFSGPLGNLAQPDDFLIVITGSGNSTNIIEVLKVAKKLKVESFGILGFDGGKAKELADEHLLIDTSHYGIVEDVHLVENHIVTEVLKSFL